MSDCDSIEIGKKGRSIDSHLEQILSQRRSITFLDNDSFKFTEFFRDPLVMRVRVCGKAAALDGDAWAHMRWPERCDRVKLKWITVLWILP